jgi:hypothetical protein
MAEPVGEDQWTLFEQELGDVRWYDTELTDELREVLYALLADAQAGRTATKFH